MKITVLAAAVAATTLISSLPSAPASARAQHCYTYNKQVCRPTHHGTTVCQTTTHRRCVTSYNDLRKKESLQDRFVNRSRRFRNR